MLWGYNKKVQTAGNYRTNNTFASTNKILKNDRGQGKGKPREENTLGDPSTNYNVCTFFLNLDSNKP